MRIWLLFILLEISFPILSQQQGLKQLMHISGATPEVVQYNLGLSTFFEIEQIQAPYMNGIAQHLVKNRNGLFLLPDGTGRVYQVFGSGKDLKLIRQDSTLYFGYNFGFHPFSFRDTLYSLGGYGYWRFNGHLRRFVPQRGEWELENLNREIPFTRVAYAATPKWLDQQTGKFWFAGSIDSREGLKQNGAGAKSIVDSVYVLDLQEKCWTSVGALSAELKAIASTLNNRSLGSSPWGQLIHDAGNSIIYLVDFSNNSLSRLNVGDTRIISSLLEQSGILFFRDSTLYVGEKSRQLDSLMLSRSKFKQIDQFVYVRTEVEVSESKSSESFWGMWILATLSLLVITLFFTLKAKHLRGQATSNEKLNGSAIKLFDEKEIEILKLISAKSEKGLGTSIDEMNKALGVVQKNIEVQKKQRSETITAINRKWRFKNDSHDLLIKSRRTEYDKRSFEYFIALEDIEKIEALITQIH